MPALPSSPARHETAGVLENRFSRSGRFKATLRRKLYDFRWGVLVLFASGTKRAADWTAAATFLLLAGPLFLAAALVAGARRQPVLARTARVGRWCEEFEELSFSPGLGVLGRSRLFRRLPVLCNILKGEMSFVGPRAAAPGEMSPRQREVRRRYDVRPGVVCLWWVRQRANIAYESESALDRDYVDSHSAVTDAGIVLRSLPAALYGTAPGAAPDVVRILGIGMANLTMTEALEWIVARLHGNDAAQVCFVNPDCANLSVANAAYRDVLARARLVLADGIGLKIAGKILGMPIKQNVNGTDLFPRLMQALGGTGLSVYLLGARPGVADLVAAWIREHHPAVRIAGARHGYFTPAEEPALLAEIRDSRADLLLVAFGAPAQDVWIARNLSATGVKVAMGVGGLFDFYSGRIPRAPVWMREIGMEWFYRFVQEPRRMWKRYFVGNALFLARVWRQRKTGVRSGAAA